MLKSLRIAFMWLLAFAVPVQGFAATTMIFCMGGSHHQVERVANTVSHHSSGAQHDHADGHMHDHHHAELSDQVGHDASVDSHGDSTTHKIAGKCSTCAACCMSVAIPTTLIKFEPLKISSDLAVLELSSHPVFLTDGPERPPRSFLA